MVQAEKIDLTSLATQAMMEKGFIPNFPVNVQKEIATIQAPSIPIKEIDARDMRHLLWFSIDNDDSRDLDQLTYAETLPDGKSKIYVAVALVDLLVKKGDAIDHRAANNTTSVYTPTKIFPMLPEMLSTDLTSLNPDQDRLAMIFESNFVNNTCSVEEGSIYLAYVHNYAQLAYNSVSAWLDGNAPIPPAAAKVPGLQEQIHVQDKIAQQLAACREQHGSLTLEPIDPKPIMADGVPVAIIETKKTRAGMLIENFMIVANTVSARYSQSHKILSLRRVIDTPKRWDKIVEIARQHNFKLSDSPDPIALEKFLTTQKQANPLTFPDLSLLVIKLLGRGEYRMAVPGQSMPGHFGLALHDYSHSTAPNRRYPDLITQRLLLASIAKQPSPYTTGELSKLADHCTEKEDDAEKVERRMRKSAAAMILSTQIGKQFDGVITGAGSSGTWVRVLNPPVEGKIVKGAENLDVGDRVSVKLIHTDIYSGFIDFVKA